MYHGILIHGDSMSIELVASGEATTTSKTPRLTPEEISKYGKDLQAGHLFGSWQIRESDNVMLGSIFMILIFLDDITTKQLINDGAVYCMEYISESANMNINGYPIFYSCRFLVKDDVELIIAKADQVHKMLAEL